MGMSVGRLSGQTGTTPFVLVGLVVTEVTGVVRTNRLGSLKGHGKSFSEWRPGRILEVLPLHLPV